MDNIDLIDELNIENIPNDTRSINILTITNELDINIDNLNNYNFVINYDDGLDTEIIREFIKSLLIKINNGYDIINYNDSVNLKLENGDAYFFEIYYDMYGFVKDYFDKKYNNKNIDKLEERYKNRICVLSGIFQLLNSMLQFIFPNKYTKKLERDLEINMSVSPSEGKYPCNSLKISYCITNNYVNFFDNFINNDNLKEYHEYKILNNWFNKYNIDIILRNKDEFHRFMTTNIALKSKKELEDIFTYPKITNNKLLSTFVINKKINSISMSYTKEDTPFGDIRKKTTYTVNMNIDKIYFNIIGPIDL
jgi:hypothetical protein